MLRVQQCPPLPHSASGCSYPCVEYPGLGRRGQAPGTLFCTLGRSPGICTLSPCSYVGASPGAASYLFLGFEDVAPEGVVCAVPCDVTEYFQVLRVMRDVENSRWERDKGNETPWGVSALQTTSAPVCPQDGLVCSPQTGRMRQCWCMAPPAIFKAGGDGFRECFRLDGKPSGF